MFRFARGQVESVTKRSEGKAKSPPRQARADAQRNLEKLLAAAQVVFEEKGTDAPIRDIAARADVGVATLYRHFPRREDLLAAVFASELEACASKAPDLAAKLPPFEALAAWTLEFTVLACSKRGLAKVISDPAFASLPERRDSLLRPAFRSLFSAAVQTGKVRSDVDPDEFMDAVSSLCLAAHDTRLEYAQRMVSLFLDSLRWSADTRPAPNKS